MNSIGSIVTAIVLAASGAPRGDVAGLQPRHEDGQVELYVSDFHVHPEGDAQRAHATVVDRDSGTPAPGFDVTMTATGRGTTVGPIALTSDDEGNYTAVVELEPGSWTVTIRAQQGGSATPAKASSGTFTIEVGNGDADGASTAWRTALLSGGGAALAIAVFLVLRSRSRIRT